MTTIDKRYGRRVLAAVLALAAAIASRASAYQRLYGSESLSSNLVEDICQDARGYVWIATEYGLNRFDGVYFTQYYDDTGEGLAKNDVKLLMPDGDRLWVAGIRFVQMYSPADNQFYDVSVPEAYLNTFKSMAKSPDGEIWILSSGKGILRVDRKNMTARPVEDVNRKIGKVEGKSMKIDSRGRLWISTTSDGLLMYDTHSGKVHRYFDNTPIASNISGVMEGRKGAIAVATNNSGIYLYDGRTDTMRLLCGVPGNTIVRTYGNRRGDMFVGTDRKGLWRVDIQRGTVEPAYQTSGGIDIPGTNVWAFCEDKDGNAWIGFHRSGVMFISQEQQPFNYIAMSQVNGGNGRNLLSVSSLRNGNLLLCQEGNGIFEITQGGQVRNHWMTGVGVSSVMQLDGNRLLIGTNYNRGVGMLDMRTGHVAWVSSLGHLGNPVKGFARDARGNIYIAVFSLGLHSLAPDGQTPRKLCGGSLKLSNKYLNTIKCDSHGLLWIGHYYGIDVYDTKRDRLVGIQVDSTLRSSVVYDISESRDGLMWFGTNRGLFSYDRAKRKWKRYSKADGLSSGIVCGIVDAGDGSIWVSTLRGLCRLDTNTGRIAAFYRGNGLKDDDYLRSAYGLSPYGLVYFANERGVTFFMPSAMHDYGFPRGVTMTGVYLMGRQVMMQGDGVHLDYHDNTFTLRFSTMDFREADNIYYEYRFADESDTVWHQTQAGTSEITLIHLPPGNHKLLVRACEGGVTSAVQTIDIRITPPWWRSWWAYTLYIMAALAVVALAFFAYRRKQQADNNESKIRFLIDIGHELRSPLTLIKSPLDMLLRNDYGPEANRALHNMERNANRMLGLVNQILGIRRIEKGQMKLHYAATDMETFVGDIVHDYDYEAKRRGITLTFNAAGGHKEAYIDRDHFDKVVSNLLANALKYTPDGGTVSVMFAGGDDGVSFTVADSGPGIDEKQLKRVFERFYQVSSRSASGQLGFGIGLNLTYKIVKLHGGTVVARNRTDGQSGSVFTVTLPSGSGHLPKGSVVDASYFTDRLGHKAESRTATQSTDSTAEKPRKVRSATGYRVAVVDDDEEIRSFLKAELGRYYHVDVYANGLEALEAITDTLPDIVVSDVVMPGMDGFTLLRRLKNNTKTSHIPVVLLTTKVEHASRVEGLDYGADAYIDKPFDLEELQASISMLIANRRRVRGKFSGVQEQKDVVRHIELKGNDEQLMDRIMQAVNGRLADSAFNVEALASEVGLSRVQLHRRVKEMTGITVGEFIRNLRMQQAARLLEQGDITVAQVTYAVGMVNPTHFSAAFKKYFGVSPSEYMMKHAKDGTHEA